VLPRFLLALPFEIEKHILMHPEISPKFGILKFQGHVESTIEKHFLG
jgi:hypothetical protein